MNLPPPEYPNRFSLMQQEVVERARLEAQIASEKYYREKLASRWENIWFVYPFTSEQQKRIFKQFPLLKYESGLKIISPEETEKNGCLLSDRCLWTAVHWGDLSTLDMQAVDSLGRGDKSPWANSTGRTITTITVNNPDGTRTLVDGLYETFLEPITVRATGKPAWTPTDNPLPEYQKRKIAIYTVNDPIRGAIFNHAAVQDGSGGWVSKLGPWPETIGHSMLGTINEPGDGLARPTHYFVRDDKTANLGLKPKQ